MSVAYQELNLDELGFLGRGKSKHRPRNDPALYGGDFPFIQTGNVKAANLHIKEYSVTYNEVGLAQSKLWDKGTLLITIAANIAETAVLDIKACFPDSIVGFVPDESKVNSYFVKYYIDFIKREIQSVSHGTTQDNLSLDKIRTFKLKIPEKRIVDKITDVLLSYDNLIENNNRRIIILEDMAQSLYQEWFVKFRFPGHQNTKLKESSLGLIPEGWEVKKLFDVSSPTYGFAFKSRQFNENNEGTKIVRIRNVPISDSVTYTLEIPKKAEQVLKNGDLLIGMDGDFHMGKWSGGHAHLCQRVVKISPNEEVSPYFVFLSFKQPIINLNKSIVGTTVAHLGDKHLQEINIVVPEETVFKKFSSIVDPIFKEELNLDIRNKNLKKQRDLLLPKLISGKISLNE